MMRRVSAAILLLLLFAACACACETVLTHAEIAADRARAVEFLGPSLGATFGEAVCAAGDVNGDGFGDVAIAAPVENADEGAVYVVFGRTAAEWASAQFEFNASDTPDNASWIKISGGSAVSIGSNGMTHGDFNGDGLSDLLISTNSGGFAFCVYGRRGNWSSFSVAEIGGGDLPGFVLSTTGTNPLCVGNAGDMNGDGIEDLLVSDSSKAYIVFGTAGPTRSAFDLGNINGANGFSLTDGTSTLGHLGSMGSAGDVNGDGLADLAIGSTNYNNNAGRAYVLFARNVSDSGQWTTPFNLTTEIDGNNGFIVEGTLSLFLGFATVGAGDVNADGFADVFIGSKSSSDGAWIVFGHPAPWTSPLSASSLDGTNSFHFTDSESALEYWGWSGGCAGDVNGDGFDDVIIGGYGAPGSLGNESGAAAIIFGHNGPWPAELNRADSVGSVGFLIDGPSSKSRFGISARGAGDVNGDGLADFIVGAPKHSSGTGYAVLVFGIADDHCAVCSNTTDACLVCDDGFFLNSTACEFGDPPFLFSSSFPSPPSSGVQQGSSSDADSPSSGAGTAVVVVIETGGGGSASEVAAEIAQLLGVDVGQISIIEITPGIFEVTVTNEEIAQQLVTLIEQCMEGASSDM